MKWLALIALLSSSGCVCGFGADLKVRKVGLSCSAKEERRSYYSVDGGTETLQHQSQVKGKRPC